MSKSTKNTSKQMKKKHDMKMDSCDWFKTNIY